MKRVFGRPSPAMVVAIVALIAALGGSAIGAVAITKKKAKKIANAQITKRAPGLSVAKAKDADNATNATNATTAGNLADRSQEIQAWASIDNDAAGTVLASKNVTSVVKDGTGRYCFDLPFTPHTATATVDGNNGNLANRIIVSVNNAIPCPASHQDIRVFTDNGAGVDANVGFFIHIN